MNGFFILLSSTRTWPLWVGTASLSALMARTFVTISTLLMSSNNGLIPTVLRLIFKPRHCYDIVGSGLIHAALDSKLNFCIQLLAKSPEPHTSVKNFLFLRVYRVTFIPWLNELRFEQNFASFGSVDNWPKCGIKLMRTHWSTDWYFIAKKCISENL